MRARIDVEKSPGRGEKRADRRHRDPLPGQQGARGTRASRELVREKKLEGIAEVRDESDRDGMRLVIELKKDVIPQVVINQLYRLTDLQTTLGVINLAIVAGAPRGPRTSRRRSQAFIEHRRDVVTRRTRFELSQAEAQREIVEGLGVAVTEVDLVVKTIRESADPDVARDRPHGAAARRARGVRRARRAARRARSTRRRRRTRTRSPSGRRRPSSRCASRASRASSTRSSPRSTASSATTIARLRAILASPKLLDDVIVMELEEIKAKYADKRRTEIVENEAEILEEDLIQEEDMVVTISHAGYIKRTSPKDYRAQKRGGKGRIGMEAREEDWVTQLFVASTHAYVFFFSDKGKVYVKKVYEIPLAARTSKGRAIVNFVGMEAGREGRGDRRSCRRSRRASSSSRSRSTGRSRRPRSTSTRTSARRASSA